MKPPCKGHYRGYQPPSHRGLLKPEQPVIEDYLQDPKKQNNKYNNNDRFKNVRNTPLYCSQLKEKGRK